MPQKQSPDRRNRLNRLKPVVFLLSLLVFATLMWPDLPAEFLVVSDLPAHTDAALVFGGDPGFERTIHASNVLLSGLTDLLIFCGGEPGPGDHARSLQQVAMARGVPEEKTLIEGQSTSTYEAVVFAKPILEKRRIRSLTLVTSPYHQRRVSLAARRALGDEVELVNSPADPSFWSPEGWWKSRRDIRIVLTEYGKMAYYFLRGWI